MADHVKHPQAEIARAVCAAFGVEEERLRGSLRLRPFVRARQAFMLLARREAYSFPQIGRFLNRRDHTTVMHGCGRARKLMAEEPAFAAKIGEAKARLEQARQEREGADA